MAAGRGLRGRPPAVPRAGGRRGARPRGPSPRGGVEVARRPSSRSGSRSSRARSRPRPSLPRLELAAQRVGHALEPELGGVIGREEGRGDAAADRGDEDDRAPPRRSSGRKAWVTAYWPTRLTSITFLNPSTGRCSTGPPPAMPALLTRPARPLLADGALDLLARGVDRGLLGDVDRDRGQPLRALLLEAVGVVLLADAGEDPVALLGPGAARSPARCRSRPR